jgi:hypothetical protein
VSFLSLEPQAAVAAGLRVEVCPTVDEGAWDRRVGTVDEGTYRQTSLYGLYQAELRREEPLYFIAKDSTGKVCGQLLAMLGGVGAWGLARRRGARYSLPVARHLLPQIYWAEGPLVFTPGMRRQIVGAILARLDDEIGRRGCVHVEGMPSFYGDGFEQSREIDAEAFESFDFKRAKIHTLRIDLRRDPEELWSRLKREARTKVRKARDQDIRIESLDGDPVRLRQAYDTLVQTCRRNGTAPLEWDVFSHSYRFHHDHGLAAAFVSLKGDEVLSYQRVAFYNGVALLGGVSYADSSRERGLYGNDLMQWHMIEWAKEKGMRWLDYGGAVPEATTAKLQGIYRFKAKWGGDLVEYDYYRRPLRSSWRGRAFGALEGVGRRLLAMHH